MKLEELLDGLEPEQYAELMEKVSVFRGRIGGTVEVK